MSFLFKKSKPKLPAEFLAPDDEQHRKDLEEDGFVLVGQTEDERNAITPDKRDSTHDLPPVYQAPRQGPPPPLYQNDPPNPEYENLKWNRAESAPSSARNHEAKTPLHDIPFKIDDSVAYAFNYGQINMDIGDEFSWTTAQYQYDFTVERSIVQQSEPF